MSQAGRERREAVRRQKAGLPKETKAEAEFREKYFKENKKEPFQDPEGYEKEVMAAIKQKNKGGSK